MTLNEAYALLKVTQLEHEAAMREFQAKRTPEGAKACREAYNRYLEVNKRLQQLLGTESKVS